MTEATKGVLAMLGCCALWGLSGAYYALLREVPVLEVMAHRTFWSFIVFAGIILATGRMARLRTALSTGPTLRRIAVSALVISFNWTLFIYAIHSGQAIESSLGYYIFPFVAVVLGVVVFAERPSPVQWGAIVLAGVAVLTLTFGLGAAPWIAIALAFSFGAYGLLKKRLSEGPITTVTAEVLLLLPLSLGFILWLEVQGQGAFGRSLHTSLLLIGAGVLTGGPLILFSYAAQRLTYGTLGVLQYLNPTLQFATAVLVLGEAVTPWHMLAFPLIWVAVIIFSRAALRQDKASRSRDITASGVS